MDKEKKKEILDKIKKASSEEYETYWDEKGIPKSKKKIKVSQGKKSKTSGTDFERRVRKDLEEKNWIVDKWTNNLDLENNKIIPAKRVFKKFRSNMGVMTIGTGFPDFIAFQKREDNYQIIGVEVKSNGFLSKIEKEKCAWYLEKNIFSDLWIAKKEKIKNRVKVVYDNFSGVYPKYLI